MEEEKREVTSRALILQVINQGSEAHEMNLVKLAKSKGQGFSNVALLGSKPPPQMNQEHVVGLALPRQTDNMLFYSFLGRGGDTRAWLLVRSNPYY
jgi:hypothetical protein